jgi:hypothetical protein
MIQELAIDAVAGVIDKPVSAPVPQDEQIRLLGLERTANFTKVMKRLLKRHVPVALVYCVVTERPAEDLACFPIDRMAL